MRILLELFAAFFRIGLFTFGGGYAMIPLIISDCVERRKWIDDDEMMTLTAIAESTPGPVAINCATWIGWRRAGFAGAAAATIGVVLPSFLIIFPISLYLDSFLEIRWIAGAFRGIRIAVGVVIVNAGIRMLKKTEKTALNLCIAACAFAAAAAAGFLPFHVSTVVLILGGGAAGLAVFALRKRSAAAGRGEKR